MKNKIIGLIILTALLLSACAGGQTAPAAEEAAEVAEEAVEEAAAEAPAETPDTYYIGLAIPITGPLAAAGEQVIKAVDLAISEINAAGGVNGAMLESVPLDDKNDTTEAALVAQRFAEDDRIVAVIGHITSAATLAALPIYDEVDMPILTPTANSADIVYDGLLRLCLVSTVQGPQVGAMVSNNLGAKKVAILYANDDFGIGMRDQTTPVIESFGGEVVSADPFTPGTDKDFSVLLSKVLKNSPDAVIALGTYNEGSLIVSQAAAMGGFEEIEFASDASWLHELFLERVGGTALEGNVYLACGYNPFDTRPAHQEFLAKFAEVYEGEPSEPSIYAYDAVKIIAESLEAGATRETLASVAKTLTFTGLACDDNVTFTEKGNRTQVGMDIVTIKDGKYVPYGEKVDVSGLELDY